MDSQEDVLKGADICLDNHVTIETGPHKHSINPTFFLYVLEPGGNRFEIANAAATHLIFAPDWQPVTWNKEERKKGQAWSLKTIGSFHTFRMPPVDVNYSRAERRITCASYIVFNPVAPHWRSDEPCTPFTPLP